MQQTSEELRAWFKRVQPIYVELFNAAHAMCGNYDMAEYALRSALLDVWLQNATGGMGFRERLRSALRREAFDAALSEDGAAAEFTWQGVSPLREGEDISAQLAQERVETQRLVMLRHGCGLSPRSISRLTGLSQGQVRTELDRFEARCCRKLPRQERSRADALITRQAKRLLAQSSANVPQPAQVYRAFEAEADGARVSDHRAGRILGGVLLTLMALLCAGTFWLFAVLVQPV